jgi:hypothetical protein
VSAVVDPFDDVDQFGSKLVHQAHVKSPTSEF